MIFSVNYRSKNKTKAQEIKCPYNQLGNIYKFIKENPNKRYNITLPADADLDKAIEQVNLVRSLTPNYTIEVTDLLYLSTLLKKGYNAYSKYQITDWEAYTDALSLGVSDIYIDGPLGFSMNKIAKSKGETKIRVSPTISPNTSLSATRSLSSFFIRPEDLPLYSPIDVIDFHEYNEDKENALFSIYTRGTFNYNINELIAGLPSVNNLVFKEDFVKPRLNCGQICRIPGKSCHHCKSYFNVSQGLQHLAQIKRKPKQEEEKNSK